MKVLSDMSYESALADPDSVVASLSYAEQFTRRYLELEQEPAELREAALLELQFPACLQPVLEGDRFAGRIYYGLVGVSPEPCGLGYYCASGALRQWLQLGKGSADWKKTVEWLLDTWNGRTTAEKVRAAYPDDLARILPSDAWSDDSGVGFPLYRIAGTVHDYEKLLRLGIDGLAGEVCQSVPEPLREAMLRALRVLQSSIRFYATTSDDSEIVDSLQSIESGPAGSFREAIQLFWLYALHSGTWNYGRLDDILGPYLVKDLENGVLDEAAALELVCSLWRLMHSYSNQYNNRVIIGGRGRSHEAAADQFALLALEATRRVRLNQPQLSLRFHQKQNPALFERALTVIGEGCTFPILYNDDVNVPAVMNAFSVDEDMALQYMPFGCGEYVLSHFGMSTPNGVINLTKALEIALHGGVDLFTGETLLNLPAAEEHTDMESLWRAYQETVEHYTTTLARQQKLEYEVVARELPLLFTSMLTSDCLPRGRSLLAGGVRHLCGTLETYGNTNAADSLHAIDELVFKQKYCSLSDLVTALDADFRGHEALQQKLLKTTKYGNDEGLADAMAIRVHEHICEFTKKQAERVGLDSYLIVIINNWANTVLGRKTGASADGRLSGTPLANGNNPSPGSDLSGPTAFLNSLAKLRPEIHAGSVQNMKFSKVWFSDRQRPKLETLLDIYFKQGGSQAMITVVSRDDLKAAMQEPEKWGHLLVRVGGFSIRFIDLPEAAQREVLMRTLH